MLRCGDSICCCGPLKRARQSETKTSICFRRRNSLMDKEVVVDMVKVVENCVKSDNYCCRSCNKEHFDGISRKTPTVYH